MVVINRGRLAAQGPVAELNLSRHTDNLESLFFDLTSNRTPEVSQS